MEVCSTRDAGVRLSFSASLLAGLPPGGGLYQPCPPPDLTDVIAALPDEVPFVDLAAAMTEALLGDELADAGTPAHEVAAAAYPFAPALSWLSDEIALLELYHGPTCAFKDFGAAFLAALLERQLAGGADAAGGGPVVVLVATSGDTGGAVARAFWRRAGIEVVLLYPSGRISRLQEQQLTALGDNIHAVEVAGSFDDCQRLVKQALIDRELVAAARLCPANSISLGRLLPQAYYYIFAALRLRSAGNPLFCVPSGNFGNLTAGVYAAQWGLPVAGFLAATNRNDVVPRYLDSGELIPHLSFATLSNAMDVGDPSNFERILARWDRDHAAVGAHLRGCAVSDADTLATMRDVHRRDGRLVDPHTAVGIAAARRLRATVAAGAGQPPLVVLATADAGKFPETVRRATGVEPAIPAPLQELLERPKQAVPLVPRYEALRSFILEQTAAGG
jgi:threonine synthase